MISKDTSHPAPSAADTPDETDAEHWSSMLAAARDALFGRALALSALAVSAWGKLGTGVVDAAQVRHWTGFGLDWMESADRLRAQHLELAAAFGLPRGPVLGGDFPAPAAPAPDATQVNLQAHAARLARLEARLDQIEGRKTPAKPGAATPPQKIGC
jgi:hypothetical protein